MLKINEYFYHLRGKDLFVQKNHAHNEIELIQVVSGNGLLLKNDKSFLFAPGHLFVIDARRTHLVFPRSTDCHDYVRNKLVIDADSFMGFCNDMGLRRVAEALFDSAPIPTRTLPEIDGIYKTATALCTAGGKENVGFAHGYVLRLLHLLYENMGVSVTAESKDTVQKMLDIIGKKDGCTTLEEIGGLLYMNKHYLCHLFKEKTGVTLSAYLADKKWEKGCSLLKNTSYSVGSIAEMCGFSSSPSFTRFFKEKSGMSPVTYRKKNGVK